MKYIVRALKYFAYLMLMLCLIIGVLVATHFVEADVSTMFVNGYDSIWQIALIMFVLAMFYPRFGFSSRMAHVGGSQAELRSDILRVMDLHGYKLESEQQGTMTFIKSSPVTRALKMWEDRISLEFCAGGIEVEGLTRDLVRVVSGLEASRGCE